MALKLKMGQGREVEVGDEEVSIGREDCDVTLDDDEVSRRHASIKPLPGGQAELTDLGSRNGTFVDGKRVEGPVTISGGETIRIGQTEIATEAVPPPAGETRISGSPGLAPTVAGEVPAPPPPSPPTAPAPPPPPPPAAPGKKRGPGLWLWLLIGGIVLILAAAAAWYFLIRETAEEQIEAVVERVFVTADPDACDFFTDSFYEEAGAATDDTPDEARAACREAEVTPSETATLTNLEIDGDTATGTVEFTVDDQEGTSEVTFADEDGWKVDALGFGE